MVILPIITKKPTKSAETLKNAVNTSLANPGMQNLQNDLKKSAVTVAANLAKSPVSTVVSKLNTQPAHTTTSGSFGTPTQINAGFAPYKDIKTAEHDLNLNKMANELIQKAQNGYMPPSSTTTPTTTPTTTTDTTSYSDYVNYSVPEVSAPAQQNNDLEAILRAYLDKQQEQLRAQQEEQQRLVKSAYDNNIANLLDAYNQRVGLLGDTYNSTLEQLGNNYNAGADTINHNAEQALREAYINRMLSQKNLAQAMSASGLSGGATESTLAGMLNNYGNARNNIETQRGNDIASLLNTYQNNVAGARETYNNALADASAQNNNYRRQIENDLASNLVGTYGNLYNALASGNNTFANAMTNYAVNQANNAANLAANNYKNYLNSVYKASTGSSKSSSTSSNTASDSSILAQAQQYAKNGKQLDEYLTSVYGTDTAAKNKILKSLGLIK